MRDRLDPHDGIDRSADHPDSKSQQIVTDPYVAYAQKTSGTCCSNGASAPDRAMASVFYFA
jgi:hypothetical protein